jgi:hypothetical protein
MGLAWLDQVLWGAVLLGLGMLVGWVAGRVSRLPPDQGNPWEDRATREWDGGVGSNSWWDQGKMVIFGAMSGDGPFLGWLGPVWRPIGLAFGGD